jgi:glycosyltransferase involved in cell wall biosynthesis
MKPRPLFVTGSLGHGGAERHAIGLLNALAARGHECAAVYVKNEEKQLSRIRGAAPEAVRCLDASRFLDRRALMRFARFLLEFRPAVLVAANEYALTYATLANRWSGLHAPVVATFHTTWLQGAAEHVKMLLARPCFWSATRTVFVCERQRRHWLWRGVGSRHNEVIYNGIDTEHFRDRSTPESRAMLRQGFGFAEGDFVIGISAVLRPEKNHSQLVDALFALRGSRLPARLLIIGDGPLRAEVEAQAAALDLADSVRVTGFVLDVRPFLAICDAMVLCSLTETFSLAGLEGMAMGKPLVLSDVGGAAEMVEAGVTGDLFPVGDTDALVAALAKLAEPGRAPPMGAAARRAVETRFSETTMVDRYERLLAEVCIEDRRFAGPQGLKPIEEKTGHENV